MPAITQRIPVAEGMKLKSVYCSGNATAAGLSLQYGEQN